MRVPIFRRLSAALQRVIVGPTLPAPVKTPSASQRESAKAAYDQLCISYRDIDAFRAKLLGFLPLATGTGVFLLFEKLSAPTAEQKLLLLPIGIFGFLVTLGLFSYEVYGIRKCHALIEGGTEMEESLGTVGQFRKRPRGVAGVINEPFAAALIYPTVLAAWVYTGLTYVSPQAHQWIALSTFVVLCAAALLYNRVLGKSVHRITTVSAQPVDRRSAASQVATPESGGNWRVRELRAVRTWAPDST